MCEDGVARFHIDNPPRRVRCGSRSRTRTRTRSKSRSRLRHARGSRSKPGGPAGLNAELQGSRDESRSRPGGPVASSRGRAALRRCPRSGYCIEVSPGRGDRSKNIHSVCRPCRGSLFACASTGGRVPLRGTCPRLLATGPPGLGAGINGMSPGQFGRARFATGPPGLGSGSRCGPNASAGANPESRSFRETRTREKQQGP